MTKRFGYVLVTLLLLAGMALAQNSGNQGTQSGNNPSGQNKGGGFQLDTDKPAQPPAQTAPHPGHKLPEIKSPEEQQDYQKVQLAILDPKSDPAQLEASVNEFEVKYPKSDLRPLLYYYVGVRYSQAKNVEKELAMFRKGIEIDPTYVDALINDAFLLAETTSDSQLDRDRRLDEAERNAKKAIESMDVGLYFPPNVTPDQVTAEKTKKTYIAYSVLGTAQLGKKDYPAAAASLQKAIEIGGSTVDAETWFRLGLAQDNLGKFSEALASVTKAEALVQAGDPLKTTIQGEKQRLQLKVAEKK